MNIMNYPLVVAFLCFLMMWATAQLGARLFMGVRRLDAEEKDFYGFVVGATLTLLGLIIGFSFSMAIGRYDQRKNYEEEEANAIGTEYLRLDLLPAAGGEKLRALMSRYLEQRVKFYQTRSVDELRQINAVTAQLQNEMWSEVKAPALAAPSAVSALAVSGMNDVLNRQGYTQAAWWNRIPVAAWCMMAAIAVSCNVMLGFAVRHAPAKKTLLLVLPIILSISFFLLADLDSPRGGMIRVRPQNLLSLQESMRP
jgi:hypothetical protein